MHTPTPVLFILEGRAVYRGDQLFVSPEFYRNAGTIVTAEFAKSDGCEWVTVRSVNGAVPQIPMSALSWTEHADSVYIRDYINIIGHTPSIHSEAFDVFRKCQMWCHQMLAQYQPTEPQREEGTDYV